METCTLVKTRMLGGIGYASLDPMAEKQGEINLRSLVDPEQKVTQ